MRKIIILMFVVCVSAFAKAQNYTSYFTGDTADVSPTTDFGVCLMGGATESDEAMIWFLEKANGGDIVVLRASGSDGYNDYLYSELGVSVNSVETIVFNDASAAFEDYVVLQIENAEAIWIAGGDQWNYVNYWKGNEIGGLLNDHVLNGRPIGGTSAGMAILGGYYFSAENGTVTSSQALANPYNTDMTLGNQDFLSIPFVQDVITDTHFDSPDRKGRSTAFLARIATDFGTRSFGIASEEYTAVCVEEDGKAYVYGGYPEFQDFAYFLQANCSDDFAPEDCTSGGPLDWNRNEQAVKVYKVPGTETGENYFDLNDWATGSGGTWHNWWSDNGTFMEAETTEDGCEVLSLPSIGLDTVKAYPSPFTTHISVDAQAASLYEMYDILGNLVSRGDLMAKDKIDTKSFSSGVYFLMIEVGTQSQVFKLIKQ